ncbi:O-methyltransferase [Trinickia fusca]|uniref:O-methyltransferase n=1 Tax=Trinickia fusca TaxID=2419777 RepID=A0A494XX80_9BURK|nr:O-methyltransferase [Trinickia fusca]RKP52193.1 O-methyltransferase [Trinickia fusca]
MSMEQWNAVDDYLCSTLVPLDPALDAALASSSEAGLPAINVAPNQGRFLHLLARIQGARRILEIGTLGGYSTIWLARALPQGGTLTTLEVNPDYAELARRNVAHAGLADVVTVRLGDAVATLRQMIEEKTAPFDFIFIDANKESNPDYLQAALKLSRAGTVIVCDNVVRNGRVADRDNQDPDAIGVRRYFEMASANPHLPTTAIQTVGSKGWDGFAISIVEG